MSSSGAGREREEEEGIARGRQEERKRRKEKRREKRRERTFGDIRSDGRIKCPGSSGSSRANTCGIRVNALTTRVQVGQWNAVTQEKTISSIFFSFQICF